MLKDKIIFAFMVGFRLPHRQSSLRKVRTFPIKLYQPVEDPTVG